MSFVTSVESHASSSRSRPEGRDKLKREAEGLQPHRSSGRGVVAGQQNPHGTQQPVFRRAMSDIVHQADQPMLERGSHVQSRNGAKGEFLTVRRILDSLTGSPAPRVHAHI